MITILTKTDCTDCNRLKMFVTHALNDAQKSKLHFILKEDNEEQFASLVEQFDIKAVPAIIFNDELYTNVEPSKLVELISKA